MKMTLEGQFYDRDKVREIIDAYEHVHPQGPDSIAWCMIQAKQEQEELERMGAVSNRTGVINNSASGRRQKFTMPSELYILLQKKFPEIFKRDLKQFEKDFPIFFKSWRTH